MKKNEEKNNKTIFTRILIIILIIFIGTIIVFNLLNSKPIFDISGEIILCLSLLILLALSESFDNFSIGKIITMKRKIEEKEEDNNKLKETNAKLMEYMININNIKQNANQKVNVNIGVDGSYSIDDLKTKEDPINDDNPQIKTLNETNEERRKEYRVYNKLRREIEKNALEMVLNDLPSETLKKYNPQIVGNIHTLDPIMNYNVDFAAYSILGDYETFYITELRLPPLNYYKTYYELCLIKKYGEVKNAKTKLILILPILSKEAHTKYKYGYNVENQVRIFEEVFMPAILEGLIEIRKIYIDDEKADKLLEEIEKEYENEQSDIRK